MRITPLSETDNLTVREWAIDYLTRYLRERSAAYGLEMDDTAIEAHIDAHDLDGALWHDLVHGDYSQGEFVAVARQGNEPMGMVLVKERIDPFLRQPLGVIQWIYVAEKHRKKGIGDALHEAVVEWLTGRGITALETNVPVANAGAAAHYTKLGFAPAEQIFVGKA